MYSNETTKELQKATQSLLKELKHPSQMLSAELLQEVLRFHEYRYYVLNEPLISDFEYDALYKALEKLEAADPDLITSGSPTQRVAKGLTKEFPTVQHLVPMPLVEDRMRQ